MKCSVCDHEWPDEVAICPKDGNDLRARAAVPNPEAVAVAPAYGGPPRQPEPELMVSAYGIAPMPPPPDLPYDGPMVAPAYGMPPMAKPRPVLAFAIVALVIIAAIIAVVLSR